MPPRGVKKGTKRARQYEHIKEGLEQGASEDPAEEIAARTVNKERARAGESRPRRGRRPMTSRRAAAAGCARDVRARVAPATSCTRRPSIGHRRPLEDEQGPARARGRAQEALTPQPASAALRRATSSVCFERRRWA